MSLFTATLIPGLLLIAFGAPLLLGLSTAVAALKAFPRSAPVGYGVFTAAAAWFLFNVSHLSNADFGEYRLWLFIGFAAIAALSFTCVPDFLGVRGASALVLIGAMPFLDAAYMQYDRPARLFMVTLVYVAIAAAIWLGAQPWRLRAFFGWLFARPARFRGLGGLLLAYGLLLCCVAFTLR